MSGQGRAPALELAARRDRRRPFLCAAIDLAGRASFAVFLVVGLFAYDGLAEWHLLVYLAAIAITAAAMHLAPRTDHGFPAERALIVLVGTSLSVAIVLAFFDLIEIIARFW